MGRAQRAMLVAVAVLLAAAVGCGGCRPSEPTAAQGQQEIIYRPEWLSPNGRFLFMELPPIGAVAIDVSTGAQVWRSPFADNRPYEASWSPASDALCWWDLFGYATDEGGAVSYSSVPGGNPVQVLDADAVPELKGGWCNVCFTGPRTIALGTHKIGDTKEAPWQTTYRDVSLGDGGSPARVTRTVRLPAGLSPHAPSHMVAIPGGHRVLVVGRDESGNGSGDGIYVVDLDHGLVIKVFDDQTSAFAASRARWGGKLGYPYWSPLVRMASGDRWLLAVDVEIEHGGCELFALTVDGKPVAEDLGAVVAGLAPGAVLPQGKGFVFAMFVPGVKVSAPGGEQPAVNLCLLDPKLQVVRKLTEGPTRDDRPLWSAAAGRVIFRRDMREIWSVSLNGGDARRVWSPDAGAAPEGDKQR